MKRQFAIHHRPIELLEGGKWKTHTIDRIVRVMAIAENYAMVRLPGCMPYVCPVEQITLKDGKP